MRTRYQQFAYSADSNTAKLACNVARVRRELLLRFLRFISSGLFFYFHLYVFFRRRDLWMKALRPHLERTPWTIASIVVIHPWGVHDPWLNRYRAYSRNFRDCFRSKDRKRCCGQTILRLPMRKLVTMRLLSVIFTASMLFSLKSKLVDTSASVVKIQYYYSRLRT